MQGSQKLNNKRQDVSINLFQNAEPGMLSCVHVIIDTDSFQEDMIELPQSGKTNCLYHFVNTIPAS